ncbi:MAG: insulinase family protein [Clostridiales bacterium]|nr:insulinase family protein [Clostridiales bacterium]
MNGGYQRMCEEFVLSNGLRVVAEYIPHFPSVSVGLWIGAGSMFETKEESGLSHFVEHMLFKSTENRTTREIAVEMDALGGQVNAFTSKECTCYYAKVIAEHLDRAMSLLSDLLLCAKMDEEEFERERGVILEEIAMGEDTPEDLVYDLLAEAYFGDHPLARPILGTHEQIASVTRQALMAFRKKHYRPDNTVLAIAGQFDLEQFKAMAERYLGAWRAEGETHMPEPVNGCSGEVRRRKKDIEQVHICLAYPGVAQDSEDLYPLTVMNNLFGGGMSSRLFQHIREDMGAAYSVYSYPSTYANCGTMTIYAGTSPELAQDVIDALHHEIQRLMEDGVTDEEFAMAKDQLKVSYVLGLESSSSRMSSIGRSMLMRGRAIDPDDVVKKIEAVTKADVEHVIQSVLTKPCAASVVGRNVDQLKVL